MEDKNNLSLEQVIDSDYRIAILQTREPDRLLTLFKRLTLTTGRAVYDWSVDHGLYRLGIEHIFIPRTRAPADALAYINSSRHYGIYLLRDFGTAPGKPAVLQRLQELEAKHDGVRRLVILLGDDIDLPAPLAQRTARINEELSISEAG